MRVAGPGSGVYQQNRVKGSVAQLSLARGSFARASQLLKTCRRTPIIRSGLRGEVCWPSVSRLPDKLDETDLKQSRNQMALNFQNSLFDQTPE